MVVKLSLQTMDPAFYVGRKIAPKLFRRTAVALLATTKNMGDQDDAAVQAPSKIFDDEGQQLSIISLQPEHIVAGIATDIEQPTDIQSHQRSAILEPGKRRDRCLRRSLRFKGKTHIISKFGRWPRVRDQLAD